MTISFTEQNIFQGPADQVDSSPLYTLGLIAKGVDDVYGPVELVYLQAGATEIVGSVITFGGDYISALAVANAIGNIGVSISAKSANEYGWYVVKGNVPASVLASFADNAKCFLTATAGSIDDAAVTGDDIFAAKSISATGTPSVGLAIININNSFTMDGLA